MKKLICFFLFAVIVFARQVEIEAKKFETKQKNGTTVFLGNVIIKSDNNQMLAQKVIVYTDKKNKVEKFEADGNTSFVFHLDSNTTYQGKADSFVYKPKEGKLILKGNAKIEDVTNNRKIIGDNIILNEKDKSAKVVGNTQKPVRLIFEFSKEKDKNVSDNKR